MSILITVDGLAGVGKDTLADALASYLGFDRLPVGMFFRAAGLRVVKRDVDFSDLGAMMRIAEEVTRQYPHFLQDPELQSEAAARAAPKVSKIVRVHEYFTSYHKEICASPPNRRGVVADGRDLDKKLPGADANLCLVAATETRALRRWTQLREKGVQVDYAHVLAAMQERDLIDMSLSHALQPPAEKTLIIDTSHLTREQVFNRALDHIRNKAPHAILSRM